MALWVTCGTSSRTQPCHAATARCGAPSCVSGAAIATSRARRAAINLGMSFLPISRRKPFAAFPEQSCRVFRQVLRPEHFGELCVDGQRPESGRQVFASIQSLAQTADLSPTGVRPRERRRGPTHAVGQRIRSRDPTTLLAAEAHSARGRKMARDGSDEQLRGMIRKLKSGQFRLYSRKKDPRTSKRRNLGTSRRSRPRSATSAPCSSSSGTEAAVATAHIRC